MSKIEYAGIVKLLQDEIQNINSFLREIDGRKLIIPNEIHLSAHNCFCYGKELESYSLDKKKEPVKLSDNEKIDLLSALNYTWGEDVMSDKSYINLIKKVSEL